MKQRFINPGQLPQEKKTKKSDKINTVVNYSVFLPTYLFFWTLKDQKGEKKGKGNMRQQHIN
ncbi:hypothetical protein DV515_00007640 [Chloebia gouldiae]|uniref:Uncharacterized protein n=1 Tax=Chloebia gouldiae TaxID=44316 RepID=A0A3L8SGI3_CHLGU|nr:hypothetical protein DV515_00007640 [Chloebia gouldiae]